MFQPVTVPSSSLETIQDETFVSLLAFSVFDWVSVTKDRLTKEKETSILTYTSHVHL